MAAVDQPPAHEDAPPPPSTTQLEFTQAMQDFKTMFPEMDEDVIEAVLRANQGAVDATIDQLLTMSTDNENERLRTEMDAADNAESPPSYSPTTPPPSYQQAVPGNLTSPPPSPGSKGEAALKSGNAGATVDLLTFSPSEEREPSGVAQSQAAEASKLGQAAMLETSSPKKQPEKDPLRSTRNWLPPMLGSLPSDFLRVGFTVERKSMQTRVKRKRSVQLTVENGF